MATTEMEMGTGKEEVTVLKQTQQFKPIRLSQYSSMTIDKAGTSRLTTYSSEMITKTIR